MTFGDGTAEARVQARYAQYGTQEELGRAMQAAQRGTVRHIARATDRAIQFLVDLNFERFPAVTETAVREWAEGVHWSEVSAKIDWLKTQPKTLNSGVGVKHEVPAGRYAVTGERGQTVFVKVDVPEKGPFAGKAFVEIQAGSEFIRTSPATRNALLAKIVEAGVKDACIRYGVELGVCGRCGRTLTDAESRDAGIGPVCASKGW